tara:strand:+ start:603 stop:731 length:129 start_codon:yes stop_codon:yes gene_type:complete
MENDYFDFNFDFGITCQQSWGQLSIMEQAGLYDSYFQTIGEK